MRIAINGLFLGQEGTGSGQYTRQLLRALQELGGEHEYVVPPFRKGGQGGISNLRKVWFEQVTFPRACRAARAEVAHVPYWASPLWPSVPTVVTVHDLIPMLLPPYRGSLLVRGYTRLVAAAARRAAWVITDSCASQADIVRHLHIPRERVRVIPLAADAACRPVTDPAALEAVRARYGLPERYILYLGGFDARKNLRTLFAAYARLRASQGSAVPPLVVAGRLPPAEGPLFPAPQRLAREAGVDAAVLFAGWVAEEDKAALYSGALFFAFLSLYEGFGLMPLEAMACGTPVVASCSSSLPEVVGDGGLLVEPTDVEDAAAAMATLLQDGALRAHLRERALAQASRFTWRRTAEETLAVYEQAARQGGAG